MEADRPLAGSRDALMQKQLQDQKNTSSDENFDLVSRWLSDCRDTHDCGSWSKRNNPTGSWMPTRLVKVGEVGRGVTVHRLVETKELADPVEYLTLSHCWGNWRHEAIRAEDIPAFKNRIPLRVLSETFHEAFRTTRRLGFKYIWIDSLCIIQGDIDDWSKESARMSEVYGHSQLNLIAAHAKDGRDGCFHDRNILTVRPCKIPNPFNLSSDDCFLVYPLRMENIFDEEVRSSPAYKRAWILQERLLAARTLYFGKNQLFWACGKLEACEAFPSGANYGSARPHNQSPVDKQGLQLLLNRAVTAMHNKPQLISEAWARVVKMYTGANMTKASDKLIALQGIAARAQEHIGGEYLAGLWHTNEEDLLWSLLWFVEPGSKTRRIPPDYRAPSWSWASVEAQIEMSTPDPSWKHKISRPVLKVSFDLVRPLKVSIIQIRTDKADPLSAPYGAVTNGRLVIRGSLKVARFDRVGKEENFAHQFFDGRIYGRKNEYDPRPLAYCHMDDPAEPFESWKYSEEENLLRGMKCLPLIREKEKRQGGFTGSFRIHGIILLKVPPRSKSDTGLVYKRVGHFTSLTRRTFDWLEESSDEDIITII
jgi:hypothetical protein